MKRILVAVALVVASLAGVGVVAVSGAGPAGATASATVDGVRVRNLPPGLGRATDFDYEYDDVAFVSRVWESRTASGWRVDLTFDVLRGAVLRNAAALRTWLVEYQERPAAEAVYVPTTVGSRGHVQRAWIGVDQVFWLMRPGVAVLVHLDTARFSHRELYRMADSVRPTVRR